MFRVERCALIVHPAGPLTCNYPFVPNPNIDECVIKCPTPGLDDPTYSKIYQVPNPLIRFYVIV